MLSLRLRTGEFVCVIQKTTIMQILPAIQGDIAAGMDEHDSCSNFFVGHSLKGLSGCWAVLKRKSVTFVSSCQSSTILGRLTESRSTFNTLWLTQNGMYCITRTVVGLCVPPVSQVRATKKVGIRKASPWSLLYFCLSYYYNLALIFSVDLLWRDHIIV